MIYVAIALPALIVLNFMVIFMQNRRVPSLGVVNGRLTPLSKKPNGVSTQASDDTKKVETWPLKDSLSTTMKGIESAINSYGGARIIEQTDNYLYAVFTTKSMKFNDDVEFWIDEKNKEVHFRSSSRAGYSDMGLNRKRFEELKKAYNQS